MKKIILSLFLILMLLPISTGFSQKSDTPPTLSVVFTSETPYVYVDDEGYTIVVGNIENKNEISSVANVKIRVNFYDDFGTQPLESVLGGTVLEVIPELGKSPYIIKSETPNPQITQVAIFLEGFSPSSSKSQQLQAKFSDVVYGETLKLSGSLKNGGSPITDTTVYLALYDAFVPPRLIGLKSIQVGELEADEEVNFFFDEAIDPRSVSFEMFAESNVFYSNIVKGTIPQQLTKLVTISEVSITDNQGSKLSDIEVGSTVNIRSNALVQFSENQEFGEIPFRYWVQIKQSGEIPYVEYIGKFDGRFIGTDSQNISVDWIPENSGVFFIETYVWDRDNIPIADEGPIVVIVVN